MNPAAFYRSLEEVYDLFFPLEESVRAWLLKIVPEGSRVLDLGCGTGEALMSLSERVGFGLGIDLDPGFIRQANEKLGRRKPPHRLEFRTGSMTETASYIDQRPFRTVYSLGNTLAHLSGPEALVKLLGQIRAALTPDGEFHFQILNYDRLLREKPGELPPLSKDGLELKRRYRYPENGTVVFSLSVHSGKEVLSESGEMTLYPFTEKEIAEAAKISGFRLESSGSFSLAPRDPEKDFILLCRLKA